MSGRNRGTGEAPTVRWQVAVGDPTKGEKRECRSEAGARKSAAYWTARGSRVTIWRGTLKPWGGWSWVRVDDALGS